MRPLSLTACAMLLVSRSSNAFQISRTVQADNMRWLAKSFRSNRQDMKLFSSSSPTSLPLLVDSDESMIPPTTINERFADKRVAYYFAAGWCPMCTRFEPSLLQFLDAAAESGKPIEIIYVPSDRSAADQFKRSSQMGFVTVPFGEEADKLKQKYKIWSGSEALKLGFGRRSGVPALVVLGGDGEELAFLAAEAEGVKALASWPLNDENSVWGSSTS